MLFLMSFPWFLLRAVFRVLLVCFTLILSNRMFSATYSNSFLVCHFPIVLFDHVLFSVTIIQFNVTIIRTQITIYAGLVLTLKCAAVCHCSFHHPSLCRHLWSQWLHQCDVSFTVQSIVGQNSKKKELVCMLQYATCCIMAYLCFYTSVFSN